MAYAGVSATRVTLSWDKYPEEALKSPNPKGEWLTDAELERRVRQQMERSRERQTRDIIVPLPAVPDIIGDIAQIAVETAFGQCPPSEFRKYNIFVERIEAMKESIAMEKPNA